MAEERVCCPVCGRDGKHVPLVPIGKFWMHATDYARGKTCHISVWSEKPAQSKPEEQKQ